MWAVRTNGMSLVRLCLCPPRIDRRDVDGLSWFDEVISSALKATPKELSIDVSYYVTNDKTAAAIDDGASVQSGKSKLEGHGSSRNCGRPQLHAIVKEFCAEEGTVAIASAFPVRFS